jgi:hypothetical protein
MNPAAAISFKTWHIHAVVIGDQGTAHPGYF